MALVVVVLAAVFVVALVAFLVVLFAVAAFALVFAAAVLALAFAVVFVVDFALEAERRVGVFDFTRGDLLLSLGTIKTSLFNANDYNAFFHAIQLLFFPLNMLEFIKKRVCAAHWLLENAVCRALLEGNVYAPRAWCRAFPGSGLVAQLVRASPCHGEGREFESRQVRHFCRRLKRCRCFVGGALFRRRGAPRTLYCVGVNYLAW